MFKFLKYASYILVLIGAINWGLVGFFEFDLVASLFGERSVLSKLVYDIVGLSAIVSAITTYISCKNKEYM